ncbi:hypothetical protein [Nitratifractor sp.]
MAWATHPKPRRTLRVRLRFGLAYAASLRSDRFGFEATNNKQLLFV